MDIKSITVGDKMYFVGDSATDGTTISRIENIAVPGQMAMVDAWEIYVTFVSYRKPYPEQFLWKVIRTEGITIEYDLKDPRDPNDIPF